MIGFGKSFVSIFRIQIQQISIFILTLIIYIHIIKKGFYLNII